MELIDTHCHLTFDDLYGDIDSVIERSIAASVTAVEFALQCPCSF